jgi:cytochrome c peroxidase
VKRVSLPFRVRSAAFTAGAALATTLVGVALMPAALRADGGLKPLSSVPVPEPPNLGAFVQDRAAAIRLGKALFWDMQAGGDGIVACATCHNHAGADVRDKNQARRGTIGTPFGLNHQFTSAEFPFHKLADINNRGSAVLSDRNDVSGSQGVVARTFNNVNPGNPEDSGMLDPLSPFQIGGIHVRQTTGRNTPSNFNTVFNFRNFWDGRAQNEFNGVTPFGLRDTNARVWQVVGGVPTQVSISLINSSAASQAVGPPNNSVEMSWNGRKWAQLGRKMLSLTPLGQQLVHPNDSSLAALSNWPANGLNTTYAQMIQAAFKPDWWQSSQTVTLGVSGDPFTVMEANYSLFWGLAIQLYETTLISDQTRVDQYLAGNGGALTKLEKQGLSLFGGKARCTKCHTGAELTNASVSAVSAEPITRENLANGVKAVFDTGFIDNGIRPTAEDVGQGGTDPFGNPLSIARLQGSSDVIADASSFKNPGLRNVELTGPYFHNGGQATLRQVVDFYNRGGDFGNFNQARNIRPLGLTNQEKDALVAFLLALTDERVRFEAAPFDHPGLRIANGHTGNESMVFLGLGTGAAQDDIVVLPATGAAGGAPIQPFLGVNHFLP